VRSTATRGARRSISSIRRGARRSWPCATRRCNRRELPPGGRGSLSVDYAAIAAINPRIVYASISGYGQDGPRAQAAGHDINYLGYAGVLDQTGVRDGPPAICNLQIADLLGGSATAAIALLAALVGAQRTGLGRYVDVAMADACSRTT
jgi:crotonobetainyl-CoA:carnitine CoA-transferase CaiB-like acyl-CoA transferase